MLDRSHGAEPGARPEPSVGTHPGPGLWSSSLLSRPKRTGGKEQLTVSPGKREEEDGEEEFKPSDGRRERDGDGEIWTTCNAPWALARAPHPGPAGPEGGRDVDPALLRRPAALGACLRRAAGCAALVLPRPRWPGCPVPTKPSPAPAPCPAWLGSTPALPVAETGRSWARCGWFGPGGAGLAGPGWR